MIEYENLRKVNQEFFAEYKSGFEEFLNSGWYILGQSVTNFEREFANYCGSKHCIGVASGLDALILALDSQNFAKGSEVIVPSNTYIATILAVIRNGLKPVLVEPDIATYNIDPEKIEEKISPATKAIIVVHLYGKCCDMGSIMQIAKKYNLCVIEDAAQAHGATFKGQQAGTFGIGCFSFYPTKNLGALGDAGAIVTGDDNLNQQFRALRNYGSSIKYYNDCVGYNSRLDEFQAFVLSVKLKHLEKINNHKRALARLYMENLSPRFTKPSQNPDFLDVFHIFNIRTNNRDELRKYLLSNGIKTEIHYPLPPHQQKAMQGIISGNFPISEEIHNTTLSLPISYSHTPEDILKVCETMNKWQA
jgi:dTDP-4-amino-4,6-dideoxygalactose transaminase